MNVIIQVRRDSASALRRAQPNTPASRELVQTIAELGLDLQPLHPGATDAALAQYFIAVGPDNDSIDHILAQLRACVAVESAYVKPPDELP